MSGGHYDYEEFRITEVTERVAADLRCPENPEKPWMINDPVLGDLVSEVGQALYEVVHGLDYHICGDAEIKDKDEFRRDFKRKLKRILEQNNRLKY